MARPGVNIRILRSELASQAKGKIAPRAERAIQRRFDTFKRGLLRDFDNDKVTQELEEGPTASSKFVKTANGGNLFSLIGFDEGTDPVQPLRDHLEANIILDTDSKIVVKPNVIKIDKRVEIPTLAEMEEVAETQTPIAWAGTSWLRMLHRGIPWFSSYLYDPDKFENASYSRSGAAIEAKLGGKLIKLREGSQPPVPYINRLLALFKSKIVATRK